MAHNPLLQRICVTTTDCVYVFSMVFGMSGEYFKIFILLGRYATFDLWLFTDVWGQSVSPTFKVQAAFFIIDCLNLKYGTNTLSRNVGKQPPTNTA